MKKVQINFDIEECQSLDDLTAQDKKLVEKAKEATKSAYAPYSKFHVGAALLLENGEIITGTNQENSAYPSGLCAERVALFYANSKYPDVAVKTLAVCAFYNGEFTPVPTPPCGSCRQVMLETETRFDSPIKILLFGKEKILIIPNSKSLLPLSFTGDNLI
ncbi:MAG: cytidine deaminase [Bacteroidales bacterium]|nr:cytidine deaminase [Bacteroidales bacterium]